MMSHEEYDGTNRFVTVMHMWKLHHLACCSKSFVVVDQSCDIVLGRKVAMFLLKHEVLRVGKHSVESCRGRQCHWVP